VWGVGGVGVWGHSLRSTFHRLHLLRLWTPTIYFIEIESMHFYRYKAIMKPLSEKTSKTVAKLSILIIWIMGVLLALPMAVFHKFSYVYDEMGNGLKPFCSPENLEPATVTTQQSYNNKNSSSSNNTNFITNMSDMEYNYTDDDYSSEAEDFLGQRSHQLGLFQIYIIILIIMEYAIPLTIISFAYCRMSIKLWLTKTPGNAHDKRDETILINKKKFIKMLSTVVILFGLCWLPWHLYHTLALIWPQINRYYLVHRPSGSLISICL
jgi:hypothetical protein